VAFNVLVVDDSAVMRKMIVKTLRLSGLPLGEIHEAGDGQEGLRVLEEHWIDLAMVDINMPVMTGEEMIARVRENPQTRDLKVIVVSTESSETRIDMLQDQEAGFGAGFVHKPFSPETLRQKIVDLTGVSCDELTGDGIAPGSGPDF